jgi:S1-C subfamily serine protease
MAYRLPRPVKYLALLFSLLPIVFTANVSTGQVVRPPDLGVWLSHQRPSNQTDPNAAASLVVTDLLPDAVLARAGLREGDQIISLNGRAIAREQQFVDAFLTSPNVTLVIARGGQQHTLSVKSAAIMDGMVPLDPYYQAGFLIAERQPEPLTVERVFPATPAFYAGLKPNDVITSLNQQPLDSNELTKALQRGGGLRLTVNRTGQKRQLVLVIQPPSTRRSILTDVLSSGSTPPPFMAPSAPPSAPLLAPPSFSNPTPAIPSPPPAIPVLPPPGAVPGGT